jgi:putative ABC transport system permease protein
VGDRGKYWGLIMGVAFASHLMSQQVSIFVGIISCMASQIVDVSDAGIWVMDNKVRFVDEAPGLPETDLNRVTRVPGFAWAARLYKGQVRARLEDGNYRNVVMFGLDDANLVGRRRKMLRGKLSDLRRPDAVVIDKAGHEDMWPGEPFREGRELYLNDRRAVLVGICEATPPFTTMPVLDTRYSAGGRLRAPGTEPDVVRPGRSATRPRRGRGVRRRSRPARDSWRSPVTSSSGRRSTTSSSARPAFPSTSASPLRWGSSSAPWSRGRRSTYFTLENLKQFGAPQSDGRDQRACSSRTTPLRAMVVGVMGYGLGIGLTAAFFTATGGITHLAGL